SASDPSRVRARAPLAGLRVGPRDCIRPAAKARSRWRRARRRTGTHVVTSWRILLLEGARQADAWRAGACVMVTSSFAQQGLQFHCERPTVGWAAPGDDMREWVERRSRGAAGTGRGRARLAHPPRARILAAVPEGAHACASRPLPPLP